MYPMYMNNDHLCKPYLECCVIQISLDDKKRTFFIRDDRCVSFALPADQSDFAETLARL